MKRSKFYTALAAGCVLVGISTPCHAQSCAAEISTMISTVASGGYAYNFSLTGNQQRGYPEPTDPLASYAEGTLLQYNPSNSVLGTPASISGKATEFFNDRRWPDGGTSYPAPGGGPAANKAYPFNPLRTDDVGLTINQDGTLALTLYNYGGGQFHINKVMCQEGVMVGFTSSDRGQS